VTGTTASSGDHSIITGRSTVPVAARRELGEIFGVAGFGKPRAVEHVSWRSDWSRRPSARPSSNVFEPRYRWRRLPPAHSCGRGDRASPLTARPRSTTGKALANTAAASPGFARGDCNRHSELERPAGR